MRKRVVLDPNTLIDENDVESLRRFVTEYGKIIPARISGVTAAQQRQIKRGVRRARNMGLMV
ncbi:MAG: 30S ribosomal protein S18 [Kiritimatiellaeota bacterium]|nr:30S ribosomal protein S18 [Kiritimatiellota bacterium]